MLAPSQAHFSPYSLLTNRPFPGYFSQPPEIVVGFPDMFAPSAPASGCYGPMWPVPLASSPQPPTFKPSPNYPSGIYSVIYNPGLPPLVYDVFGPPPMQSSAGLTIEQKQAIMECREHNFNDRMAYWDSVREAQEDAERRAREQKAEEEPAAL